MEWARSSQWFAKAGPWWSPSPKLVLIAVLVGILQFSGLAAYASGAQMGSVSLVAATFSIYPIIPMIGGVILMHERIVPRQAARLRGSAGAWHDILRFPESIRSLPSSSLQGETSYFSSFTSPGSRRLALTAHLRPVYAPTL